jgi:hypothetical protein
MSIAFLLFGYEDMDPPFARQCGSEVGYQGDEINDKISFVFEELLAFPRDWRVLLKSMNKTIYI